MTTKPSSNAAKVSISRASDLAGEAGRRDSLTNYDLRVSDATGGKMLALITSTLHGLGGTSGWHYHPIDYQLQIVQRGWFDIEIEGGIKTRIGEGDSILLPGYTRHNVTATADGLRVLSITVPSNYDYVMTEPPESD